MAIPPSIVHHDNAPSHTPLADSKVLAKFNLAVLLQAPYSPDLAPRDFFFLHPGQERPEREVIRHNSSDPESFDEVS